jgi:RNA polymerase sigma-70 factor (ECF subfamily)
VDNVAHLEAHRSALTGHCYRMLGSLVEADDAVQETIIRAWRALDKFDGRASLRTWLYRIATNVCLDALADQKRRALPMDEAPAGSTRDPLIERLSTDWLEPVPDARALPATADPSELAVLRQSIRLAFVAALQHLPPKQRAVLLLIEVLGWSAAEAAESLDMSVAAVNSALQRARATLANRNVSRSEPAPLSQSQKSLLDRYVDAFHRYDVDRLASLLCQDAAFCMPPYELWLRGPDSVRAWLLGPGSICRESRLVPLAACGSPAFAHYHRKPGGQYSPWAIVILELSGDQISGWTSFLDTRTLFPRFGLPDELSG